MAFLGTLGHQLPTPWLPFGNEVDPSLVSSSSIIVLAFFKHKGHWVKFEVF